VLSPSKKSVPNCRQIVRRARQHLVLRRPAIDPNFHDKEILVEQFLEYWSHGDLQGLIALMAQDVTFWADGGGKVVAAQKPLCGCLKVARFLVAIRRSQLTPMLVSRVIEFNGQTGVNTVRLAVRWRLKPLLYKQSPPTRTNIRA
jgi:RNA polymerase sigma-70 factor, ECF subfamily